MEEIEMSFISNALSRLRCHYFHTHVQPAIQLAPPKLQITTRFQSHLLSYSNGLHWKNQCIANCIADVKNALQSQDFEFSEMGVSKAAYFLDKFSQAVLHISCFEWVETDD